MHFLYLDLETRSEVDVREVGPFVYAEHPSTEIICCAMALDDGPVVVWKGFDFEDGDVGLAQTLFSLAGEDAVFVAHNDDFEKCVLSQKVTGRILKREWLDTAAMSARLALPRALDELAVFLFPGRPEYHKDADGNRAMMQLTSPRRPSKENLDRFWTPVTRPEVFQRTYDYCARDVVVMRACHQKMLTFPFAHAVEPGSTMEPQEKAIHALTVKANWRGVKVDVQAARQLREYLDSKTIPLEAEFVADAGCLVKSPVKVAKALGLPDAKRYTVRNALKQDPNNRLLQLLRKLSGSAASKIDAFIRRTSEDGRLRGALVYAGAERTSRWSSWGVQLHNMKRGLGPLTEEAFTALQCGCLEQFEGTERQAPEPPCDDVTVVGEIIRGLILGPWLVGDYSQIEARGTAWLAGQEDLLRIFREGGDPYCQMASRIYGRTITKKDKSERFMGKQVVLGCGYGMSDHRFVTMLDEIYDVQVTRDFGKRAVNIYRSTNARIPLLWRTLDNGFTAVIAGSMKKVKVGPLFMGTIKHDGVPWAWIQLPSGRKIWYANAHVTGRGVRYYGRNIYKGGAWELVDTHGGKLVENCFVGGCKVLTSEGMLAIAEVKPGAKVWDGEEWVTTEGARCQGLQEVGRWLGVQVTQNHLIHDGVSWKRVMDLDEHASLQCLAWGRASVRSLCSQVSRETVEARSGLWTDTGKRELVWDLVNCGPRNRFVVLTDAGPVIAHNCVQAMSRDFLAEAMLRLAAAGYEVDLTVHDEIVCEDEGQDIGDFKAKMLVPPAWAGGFPLDVECFKCRRYRK